MDAEVRTHTFLTMIIEESVCFMSCEPIFFFSIILMWYTRNIYIYFFINWTLRMNDHLPERVQILCHAHIICIDILENRIICCQIFCDLLLESAFERIFNVMQLILVKIKWHIKWKYLIRKFHNIGLSYYFNNKIYQHVKQSATWTRHMCLLFTMVFSVDEDLCFSSPVQRPRAILQSLGVRTW